MKELLNRSHSTYWSAKQSGSTEKLAGFVHLTERALRDKRTEKSVVCKESVNCEIESLV